MSEQIRQPALSEPDRLAALLDAAEALVVVACQVGADRADVDGALDGAWTRF